MLVDLLASQLSRPATMRERFRLPFSKDDAIRVLLAAVKAEVERRNKTFIMSEALMTQTGEIAEWLTGNHSKFGMMLCGGCGNGKTTFVKAFQQILNKFEIKVDDDYSERYSIRIVNARDLARVCKEDYDEWRSLCYKRMLAIDDFVVVAIVVCAIKGQLFEDETTNFASCEDAVQQFLSVLLIPNRTALIIGVEINAEQVMEAE